jgi:ribosomal protein S18 acetylase RimI-like enzyme
MTDRPEDLTRSTIGPTIRAATIDDAKAIAQVHIESWRWAYRGAMSEGFLAALDIDEREVRWHDQIQDRDTTVLVAEAANAGVVGFASVGPSRDDDVDERTGELHALYLLREATGVGIGLALLDESKTVLRADRDRVTAWVLESNLRARDFYERAGWMWDGSRSEHRFDCANLPIVRYAADL